MNENELSKIIVDKCLKIHKGLGPGLFESVYEKVLLHELVKVGLNCKTQVPIPIIWDNKIFDKTFFADLVVENKVIIELKSIEEIAPVHKKQLLTHLKLSGIKLGLLINFGEELMKTGVTRLINGTLE